MGWNLKRMIPERIPSRHTLAQRGKCSLAVHLGPIEKSVGRTGKLVRHTDFFFVFFWTTFQDNEEVITSMYLNT